MILPSSTSDTREDGYSPVSGGLGLRLHSATRSKVTDDGRLSLHLRLPRRFHQEAPPPYEDPADVSAEQEPIAQPGQLNKWESTVPKLAILLMIVGSRGDVQPFIALSQALVAHGHRVRIATHKVFESFVRSHGLEFFDIGGDPRELMSWMVKNPGLLPKMTSLTDGSVGRQKKMLSEILLGCSQATYMPDALTGRPFAPDTIISNPPTFAHIHLAELLGVPLHMTFCMPWTPSTDFAHPLVNVMSTNANIGWTNWCSFVVAEAVTWSGLSNASLTDCGFRIAVFDTLINLQEGLSNAPLLYGSSVRRADDTDIRNLSTGFIAAGKCFVFGFYDGVVGGMFALLALPAKGIQRSTWRRRNKLLPAIREVRTRESEEAFALASLEQKTQALHAFRTLECRVSERRKARRNEHAWYYLGRENYEGLLPAEISDSSPAPTTGHNEVPQANPPVYDQLLSSMPSSSIKGGQR